MGFTFLQQGGQIEGEAGGTIEIAARIAGAHKSTAPLQWEEAFMQHLQGQGAGHKVGAKRSRVAALKVAFTAFTVMKSLSYAFSVADVPLSCVDTAHLQAQDPGALARKLVSRSHMRHMRLTGAQELHLSEAGRLSTPGCMPSQEPSPQPASMRTLSSRPIAPQASSMKRFCCKERADAARSRHRWRSIRSSCPLLRLAKRFESSGRLIDFRSMRSNANRPELRCLWPGDVDEEQQG